MLRPTLTMLQRSGMFFFLLRLSTAKPSTAAFSSLCCAPSMFLRASDNELQLHPHDMRCHKLDPHSFALSTSISSAGARWKVVNLSSAFFAKFFSPCGLVRGWQAMIVGRRRRRESTRNRAQQRRKKHKINSLIWNLLKTHSSYIALNNISFFLLSFGLILSASVVQEASDRLICEDVIGCCVTLRKSLNR